MLAVRRLVRLRPPRRPALPRPRRRRRRRSSDAYARRGRSAETDRAPARRSAARATCCSARSTTTPPSATRWGSNLNAARPSRSRKRLKQVASIIRYDASSPPTPIGARFFHVRLGGFDTHTHQGALAGTQPRSSTQLSQALNAFYDDMVELGDRRRRPLIVMTFSEFGRRVAENGGRHQRRHRPRRRVAALRGRAAERRSIAGGVYGTLPVAETPDLEGGGNLKPGTRTSAACTRPSSTSGSASPRRARAAPPGSPFTSLPFLT